MDAWMDWLFLEHGAITGAVVMAILLAVFLFVIVFAVDSAEQPLSKHVVADKSHWTESRYDVVRKRIVTDYYYRLKAADGATIDVSSEAYDLVATGEPYIGRWSEPSR